MSDDASLATRLSTLPQSPAAADPHASLLTLPSALVRDVIAPALDPRDVVNLAAGNHALRDRLQPTLMLQAPRAAHPQSIAACPPALLQRIASEMTLADIEQGFDASGLVLGRGTIMAWQRDYITTAVPRNVDDDNHGRPEARALSRAPCVAMAARRGAVVIALPQSGAPYPLREELLPRPFLRSPRRLAATRPAADSLGRNLCFQPVGRMAASGRGWRVASEHGLRTYDISGQNGSLTLQWPFHAIGATADVDRLWVLDDQHQVHTWRASSATELPSIAWKIPSERDQTPLWTAGGGGRLAVAHGGALTLVSVDGVHAPLPWPPYVATPTALLFLGHSYLALGDAKGQLTLCHWPSGQFLPAFELGSLNGHSIDDQDAVVAMVSDGPQRLYTLQKSGILRRLGASFAPDHDET